MRAVPALLVFLLLVPLAIAQSQPAETLLEWPSITTENKPWTRWWWHGSAVDEAALTAAIEDYRDAGLGGLEITPIYGVAGQEERFIDFLSPAWMRLLEHVLAEGERLDLGIDMATGTGWPFGGPGVSPSEAARYVTHRTFTLQAGERLPERVRYLQEPYLQAIGFRAASPAAAGVDNQHPVDTTFGASEHLRSDRTDISQIVEPIGDNADLQALALEQVRFEEHLPLRALVGYNDDGDVIHLAHLVDEDGALDWTAPEGLWTLYALFEGRHGKMVERAAPGGEGYVIDHFSRTALEHYLDPLSDSFSSHEISGLRAFFNDSYEVDDAFGEADWTPNYLEEFETRRGYDLRDHLPALFGDDVPEKNVRVLSDFRETISDLLLHEFTDTWGAWAETNDAITRNQAHGSPGNILDLYAASTIPEAEGTDLFRIKMASSAANVTGKGLVSAEAATWLDEHFMSNLADVKQSLNGYWLGGINHVVYHGTTFSPSNEPWPGRLFYAAVHLTQANPLWKEFAALNRYAARVQSFLQGGRPDNDVLLYYPIYDSFSRPDGSLLEHFDGTLEPFEGTTFAAGAERMQEQGFSFDFISDRQLQNVTVDGRHLRTGHSEYETLVLPRSSYVPLETLFRLVALAEAGATVIVCDALPENVPGFGNIVERSAAFERLLARIDFRHSPEDGIREAPVGEGRFIVGRDLVSLLEYADVRREPLAETGLSFVRRQEDSGAVYFIVNQADSSINGWIPLAAQAQTVAIFDPTSERLGLAETRVHESGGIEAHVDIEPGEALVLRTFLEEVHDPPFTYVRKIGPPQRLQGRWTIRFLDGGPSLPEVIHTDTLHSWTEFSTQGVEAFSGTAVYELTFSVEGDTSTAYELNLGSVRETATVFLNGEEIGTRIGPTYRLILPAGAVRSDSNIIEVHVSNSMANRIRDLDRRNAPWKKFYNINFPARSSENQDESGLFDAASWDPQPSGLLGPVSLTPVALTSGAAD